MKSLKRLKGLQRLKNEQSNYDVKTIRNKIV